MIVLMDYTEDLFIGSKGMRGIITAAVPKLFPKPQARVTAFIGCASAGMHSNSSRLRAAAGDQLTAFEYMPHSSLASTRAA